MLVKVDSFMGPQANVTCCASDLQYFFLNALTASCKSLIVCYITINTFFVFVLRHKHLYSCMVKKFIVFRPV